MQFIYWNFVHLLDCCKLKWGSQWKKKIAFLIIFTKKYNEEEEEEKWKPSQHKRQQNSKLKFRTWPFFFSIIKINFNFYCFDFCFIIVIILSSSSSPFLCYLLLLTPYVILTLVFFVLPFPNNNKIYLLLI